MERLFGKEGKVQRPQITGTTHKRQRVRVKPCTSCVKAFHNAVFSVGQPSGDRFLEVTGRTHKHPGFVSSAVLVASLPQRSLLTLSFVVLLSFIIFQAPSRMLLLPLELIFSGTRFHRGLES